MRVERIEFYTKFKNAKLDDLSQFGKVLKRYFDWQVKKRITPKETAIGRAVVRFYDQDGDNIIKNLVTVVFKVNVFIIEN